MTRETLIKRIHVLKREASLDDDLYRDILHSISGERSCAEMDNEHLNLAKIALERLVQGKQPGIETRTQNKQMQHKIAKLGYLLGWTWSDIAAFCRTQTNKRSTRGCSAKELTKVINGMVAVINDRMAGGKLVLSHADLTEFLRFTQTHKPEKEGS